MVNRYQLIRAIATGAILQGKATGQTAVQVLQGIQLAIFSGDVTSGKALVSTSEAGGSATFLMCDGLSPVETMTLIEETIAWINSLPVDSNNIPIIPPMKRILRMRASFAKGTI